MTTQTWYVKVADDCRGPFSPAHLRHLAKSATIRPTTKIRLGDQGVWRDAATVKNLFTPNDVIIASVVNDAHSPAGIKEQPAIKQRVVEASPLGSQPVLKTPARPNARRATQRNIKAPETPAFALAE